MLPVGVYPNEFNFLGNGVKYFINSRMKRCPKKGEYYISGVTMEVYQAKCDFLTKYWIATEVKLRNCENCGGSGKVVKY